MRLHLLASALCLSTALAAGCGRHESTSANASSVYVPADSAFYKSSFAWVVQTIPAPAPLRDAQGGIQVRIKATPKGRESLKNLVIWMRMRHLPTTFKTPLFFDVAFTKPAFDSMARGDFVPADLNGLKNVSPLESLAWATKRNDVFLGIRSGDLASSPDLGTVLQANEDPIQTSGPEKAMVQFVETVTTEPPTFLVRHFNPSTGKFDGPTEKMLANAFVRNTDKVTTSLRNIQFSVQNSEGWTLFGEHIDHRFLIRGIEPASLLKRKATDTVFGLEKATAYVGNGLWQDIRKDKVSTLGHSLGTQRLVYLNPVSEEATTDANQLNKQIGTAFQEGKSYFLLHIFGGIGGEKELLAIPGFTTGHFSPGIANVVRDPFTNEVRFDIDYRQIYAHNPQAIISGSQDWGQYMGNLVRGWGFSRPVGDAIISFGPMERVFTIAGKSFSFAQVVDEESTAMTIRYRTGKGSGLSSVSPWTSCVQDTSQALSFAIARFEKDLAGDPAVQSWVRDNSSSQEARDFVALSALVQDLRTLIFPMGCGRRDWNGPTDGPCHALDFEGPIGNIVNTIKTYNTMVPRDGFDRMLEIFLSHGAKILVQRPNQVGGTIDNTYPIPPTSFFRQQ